MPHAAVPTQGDESPSATELAVVFTFFTLFASVLLSCFSRLCKRKQTRRDMGAEESRRAPLPDPNPGREWTLDELRRYDGNLSDTSPICLAAKGVVYDVGQGEGFYGPGAGYGPLAGREASRSLALMELAEVETLVGDGSKMPKIDDLKKADLRVLDDWCTKYDGKYPRVGVIKGSAFKPEVVRDMSQLKARAANATGKLPTEGVPLGQQKQQEEAKRDTPS